MVQFCVGAAQLFLWPNRGRSAKAMPFREHLKTDCWRKRADCMSGVAAGWQLRGK